jgi:hypothetical protein
MEEVLKDFSGAVGPGLYLDKASVKALSGLLARDLLPMPGSFRAVTSPF